MHLARVHVHVIVLVVDVICLMLVLSARVVLHSVVIQFPLPNFCSMKSTLYKSMCLAICVLVDVLNYLDILTLVN